MEGPLNQLRLLSHILIYIKAKQKPYNSNIHESGLIMTNVHGLNNLRDPLSRTVTTFAKSHHIRTQWQ